MLKVVHHQNGVLEMVFIEVGHWKWLLEFVVEIWVKDSLNLLELVVKMHVGGVRL